MLHWSIYNEFCEDIVKHQMFLFNLLSKKYIILDQSLGLKIKDCINRPNLIENFHPDLFNQMVKNQFIVPDGTDEVAKCLSYLESKYSSKETIRITINPTLDCNLRCWYCYEKHFHGSSMSPKVIDSLIKYFNNIANERIIKNLQLAFFGGEPLLKFNSVIKPLIDNCYNICTDSKINLHINFTTNGVCLTKEVIGFLEQYKCTKSFQIAFDGGKEKHNETKYFTNKKGSYDIVKENILYALNRGIRISIRCNYTLQNIDSFKETIDSFKEFWNADNLYFSFHKVWQEPDSKELFAKEASLKQYIVSNGIKSNVDSYYGSSLSRCYADFDNNYVINFNGDVFKCTARNFNRENRLGRLSENGTIIINAKEQRNTIAKYTKECYTCKLLPICTICSQLRKESPDSCPTQEFRNNQHVNIRKYLIDLLNQDENV